MDTEILEVNKQAMDFLKSNQFEQALSRLKKAEDLLLDCSSTHPSKMWEITFNNYGSYYKHTKQFDLAVHYFEKALEINNVCSLSTANTIINIGAIHSHLKNHTKALSYMKKAIKVLKQSRDRKKDSMLVVGYFYAGLECENLNLRFQSFQFFQSALEVAQKNSHVLLSRIQKKLDSKSKRFSSTPKSLGKKSLENPENYYRHKSFYKLKKEVFYKRSFILPPISNNSLSVIHEEDQYHISPLVCDEPLVIHNIIGN